MNLKSKTNYFLITGVLILALASFLILKNGQNRPKDASAYATPSVGLLETSGSTLIVHAKSNEPGIKETFVYCLVREKSADHCVWDNADEFDLPEEGDYYIYVKSITSGKVSEPKLMTYERIDSSKVRI